MCSLLCRSRQTADMMRGEPAEDNRMNREKRALPLLIIESLISFSHPYRVVFC